MDTQKCAKYGCNRAAYTGNGIALKIGIGEVTVYLCPECFSEYLQTCMASQVQTKEASHDHNNH